MRQLLFYIFASFLSVFAQVAAQTCSPSSPCETGCCNKLGNCGFGADYCGDDCISDCDRKSECNPGFGKEWSENDKCPLNVCCSEHGFCGTTEAFCGDKKVKHKTCPRDNGVQVVVGYFEGWASSRPCNVIWPEQIPSDVYTHINFAFATINPDTYAVRPSARDDINLYKRLMLLKNNDPNLKIWISLRGWDFNDEGPTGATFSDIAASSKRQAAFIRSLTSFMFTHGFDGVDLHWEYPASKGQSGRDDDYKSFRVFMGRLKKEMESANKGVSITMPASYQYLQHLDLSALSETVDWFNIKSYDLHGKWGDDDWTGPYLKAHTNLTEIDHALDLLWRNNVDPSQVVMGLGFYGRGFTVTSPSCVEPGCTFESGGERGRCSREIGVLFNSEIDDLVEKHGVTPKLYEKEAVKVATWGDQWVSYDDEETLKMKSEFAQSRCLGGLMAWAITHDTEDAKYSKALGRVANRDMVGVPRHFETMEDMEDQLEQFRAALKEYMKDPTCYGRNFGVDAREFEAAGDASPGALSGDADQV